MNTTILYVTHALNGLLMIALPLGLGFFLTHRFQLGWRLFWIGGSVFVLSQMGHLPFNFAVGVLFQRGVLPAPPAEWALAFNAAFGGLSAGIFEEVARYLMYRYWAKESRWWGEGVLLGAGHGGVEAILLGALVLVGYLQLVALQGADLSAVSEAEAAAVRQYWSMPWPDSLIGALERLFTLPLHIACSVLVLQAFTRGGIRWLGLAVAWHALVDAIAAVWISQAYGIYAAELALGIFALLSLGIIFALRQPRPPSSDEHTREPLAVAEYIPEEVDESLENLDRTRYQS